MTRSTRRVVVVGAGAETLRAHELALRGDRDVEVVGVAADVEQLGAVLRTADADEVVLAGTDLPHEAVMHVASTALAAGLDFRLLSPDRLTVESAEPTVAVCAVRPGSGTTATAERVRALLRAAGVERVAVLECADAGLPPVRPAVQIVVVDAQRPGHELRFHPGETNLRRADVVVVNKVDEAAPHAVDRVLVDVAALNPGATVVRATSPVTLGPGPSLFGATVLVVEDAQSVGRGGLAFGAGTVAARQAGARILLDPRPYAAGAIAEAYERFPQLGSVLPAVGYEGEHLAELEAAIEAADCDVVVAATPVDLGGLIRTRHPIRRATWELREQGAPSLADALAPLLERVRRATAAA